MNRRDFIKLGPAFPAASVAAMLVLREEGKADIELDVSVLKVDPGDVLVLSVAGHLRSDTAQLIQAHMVNLIPGVKTVVLSDGLKVDGILRGPA